MNTTPDKKLTPMGELIDRIKPLIGKYGIEADAMITTAIAEARSLLEAEREYASQQAPASTPPVSANDAALMDVDKPDGVYAVNLSWGINYHPTDLSKVMKAKDCLFIGTGKECADFIYKNKPAPVSAMEDGLTVRKFMLKKFPTNVYMDCPIPKHYWETIQEYAEVYHKSLITPTK